MECWNGNRERNELHQLWKTITPSTPFPAFHHIYSPGVYLHNFMRSYDYAKFCLTVIGIALESHD